MYMNNNDFTYISLLEKFQPSPNHYNTLSLIATSLFFLFIQHLRVFYLIHTGTINFICTDMYDILSQFVHDMQYVNTANANKSYYWMSVQFQTEGIK